MKHLSRMITAHNCFCSFLYNLGTLVIMPVLLIPFSLFLMHFEKYFGILFVMIILVSIIIIADYGPYNGITVKGFFLGMILNSTHTEAFIKDAILADQIRRFIQIAFPTTVSVIIYSIRYPNKTDIKFMIITLTLILFNYSITTVTLMLLRNLHSNQAYISITFLLSILFSALNAGILLLCLHDRIKISFMIVFLSVLILSVIISISSFRYTTDHCLTNIKEN